MLYTLLKPNLLFCLLLVSGILPGQSDLIGILPYEARITKIVRPPQNLLTPKVIDLESFLDPGTPLAAPTEAFNAALHKTVTAYFQNKKPAVPRLSLAELSEDEAREFKQFATTLNSLEMSMARGGGLMLNKKQYHRDVSTILAPSANTFADKLDRDFLLFIQVDGRHIVKEKDADKPIPEQLKGSMSLGVAIIDGATGNAVVAKVKDFPRQANNFNFKVSTEVIEKELPSLLDAVFKKFDRKY